MSGHLTPRWQKERSAFNHDRLKNQFLPALAKCLNVLDDRIEDEEFEGSFLPSILLEWTFLHVQAKDLVRRFEAEMSPRTLVDSLPLHSCDMMARKALGNLVHGLWLRRWKAPELVADAEQSIAHAQAKYVALWALLPQASDAQFRDLRSLRAEFSAFCDACRQLSRDFETFPYEVRVT